MVAPPRTIPLRDYQENALAAIIGAYERGVTRQLVSLPTGAGKTFLAAHVVKNLAAPNGWRTMFMVHRDELADQSMRALQQINPLLSVGLVKADRNDLWADMMVVSAQTLARGPRLERVVEAMARHSVLFISDECFVAGTMIGQVPIEDITAGAMVDALDEVAGTMERRRVVATMSRPAPRTLYRLTVGGITTVATGNHPVYTPRGWRRVSMLRPGDEVATHVLHRVWRGDPAEATAPRAAEDVFAGVPEQSQQPNHVVHEPHARLRADDAEEPDACSGDPRSYVGHATSDRAQAADARGEREWDDRASARAPRRARARVGAGVRGEDQEAARQWVPARLQGGYREPDGHGGDRGGRLLAHVARPEGPRREEDRAPRVARVDRVEVLERGSDGEYERVCPDGMVYNLEVEGLHTYTANGIVVHNCHHDRAESRMRIIERISPDLLVGLTATPKRGDNLGLDKVYEEVVFHLPMLDLMRQGRLAMLKGKRVETAVDLDEVRVRAGEFVESDLAAAVDTPERNALLVEAWSRHAEGRKRTVVFAVNVAHATAIRDAFRSKGITSEVVLGETPADERREILSAFHAGKIQVLTNCMVLTEGYDEPAIDCIVMARPTKSQGLYIQCVGRGARTAPEKEDCLVIDMADNTSRHSLVSFPDLAGDELKPEERKMAGDAEPQGILDMIDQARKVVVRRTVEVDLFGRSPVLWHHPGAGEIFCAPAGADSGGNRWVVVMPSGDAYMPMLLTIPSDRYSSPTASPLFDRAVDIEIAKGIAEDAVEKSPLTSREAAWRKRKDPPTEAQLKFARSVGVAVHPGMTKSEVSSAIDERLFLRAAKRVGIGV